MNQTEILHHSTMLKLVVLAVCLLFSQVSAFSYPCPSPPPDGQNAMSLADAFRFQLQYPQNWYYVTGTLCEVESFLNLDCKSPLGYQLTTYGYNLSGAGVQGIVSPSLVAVSDNSVHYSWTGRGNPVSFPTPSNPFNVQFSAPASGVSINYTNVGPLPAGTFGSSYVFTAITPNVTLNLYLVSSTRAMWQGTGGYTGFPNSTACTGFYYTSMPQLYTFGNVVINGKNKLVYGTSWFDHEAGGALPGSGGSGAGKTGWVWMGLRFGEASMMAIIPRQNNVYLVGDDTTLNIQYGSLFSDSGKVTAFDVLSTWTSPEGIVFPVNVAVNTTIVGLEYLVLTPVFLNQEVGSGANHYWEGYVTVEAPLFSGEGYLELTGYQS